MEIIHLSTMLVSFGLPILVVATMVFVLISLWNRDFSQLVIALSLGVLGTFGIVVFSNIFKRAAEEAGAEATPNPTPSAALPSTAPVAQSAPDATWLWIVLGALGAILVIALLGFLLLGVVRNHRSNALELRERRAAVAADREKALAVWQRFRDSHRVLEGRVLSAETDWDTIFQYPALTDPTVPSTRELYRAMAALSSMAQDAPAELSLAMDISELPYPRRVTEAEAAWEAAWSFAKRTGTRLIPREERKKVDQIVKLLKMARDAGGSEHERSIAYERAAKLVSELRFVRVPEATLKALGAESLLMLEAGGALETSSKTSAKIPVALGS